LVVPFAMTQRLPAVSQTVLQLIATASWAAAAGLVASGENALFRERFLELTRLVMILGIAAGAALIAYNRAFVSLWVGSPRYAGEIFTLVAVCNAVLSSLSFLWGNIFNSIGEPGRLLKMAIAWAVLNVGLSILFTKFFNVVGPLLGTLVSFLAVNLWWLPILLRERFGMSIRSLIESATRPLLIGVPYA